MSTSLRRTYAVAHTARCKLQMAADAPDRNLRFILGHAFTLDKLRLRIAEIEVSGDSSSSSDSDSDSETEGNRAGNQVCSRGAPAAAERRVSFQGTGKLVGVSGGAREDRRRSPPPAPQLEEDTESDEDEDDVEDDDDGDNGLGLTRFGSAAAAPPKIVDEDEDEVDDDTDAVLGEAIEVGSKKYTEEDIKLITSGESNADMARAYTKVAGCPCHGEKGPHIENFWELPQPEGAVGPRMAVMQVA